MGIGIEAMPNLKKITPAKEERSPVEIEGENFKDFVINALKKKEAYNLIGLIEQGKLNLELEKKKIIEAGKAAEKIAESKGEEYDPTEHFIKRAEMLAGELIEKSKSN